MYLRVLGKKRRKRSLLSPWGISSSWLTASFNPLHTSERDDFMRFRSDAVRETEKKRIPWLLLSGILCVCVCGVGVYVERVPDYTHTHTPHNPLTMSPDVVSADTTWRTSAKRVAGRGGCGPTRLQTPPTYRCRGGWRGIPLADSAQWKHAGKRDCVLVSGWLMTIHTKKLGLRMVTSLKFKVSYTIGFVVKKRFYLYAVYRADKLQTVKIYRTQHFPCRSPWHTCQP